jgi:hypothetical protein
MKHFVIRVFRLSRRWCFKSRSFWVVTSSSVVVRHQRFRCPSCLHHTEDGGIMDLRNSYPTTTLLGVTTQKTSTWSLSFVVPLPFSYCACVLKRMQNTQSLHYDLQVPTSEWWCTQNFCPLLCCRHINIHCPLSRKDHCRWPLVTLY